MSDAPLSNDRAEGNVTSPEMVDNYLRDLTEEERRMKLEAAILPFVNPYLPLCLGCMDRHYIPRGDYVCWSCRKSMEQRCDAA